MAKGYHVLAGVVRDLRNALGDAADGSAAAAELIDSFNDALDVLDERGIDCDAGGEDDDGDGAEHEAEEPSASVPRETEGGVASVGTGRQYPTVNSTRARARAESRGLTPRREAQPIGVRRVPTSPRDGGKR